jgi:hypothetical protein
MFQKVIELRAEKFVLLLRCETLEMAQLMQNVRDARRLRGQLARENRSEGL